MANCMEKEQSANQVIAAKIKVPEQNWQDHSEALDILITLTGAGLGSVLAN